MQYGLDERWSLESMLDYESGVIAGLKSLPETAKLAEPWIQKRDELRKERDSRDDDRWTLSGASAKVDVRDAFWDDCVGQLSGRAFLAAGKKAGESPYAPLFGSVDAQQAKSLGAAKATAFGRMVVAKLRELNHPELAGFDAKLETCNTALEQASQERADAKEKSALHEIRRQRLMDELESLVSETEVGILTLFPGNKTLARAILAARKPRKSEKDEAPPAAEAS